MKDAPRGYIDSHQHFWQFDAVRDSWIDESMKVIQQDFLPADLLPVLQENGFEGCVVVQSNQSETETEFQLDNASQNDFIKGVVGWVDLQADNIDEQLEHYSQFKKLKGFRHVLQGEPQRDLMLKPAFMNGISLLEKHNFTYDILIFPDQLPFAATLAKTFPGQKFVVDHLAKPAIKAGDTSGWKKDIRALAKHENVYCKVSGMVTEVDWKNWKPRDFTPFIDVVVDAFGIDRLMFGSDWPVCLVAASYKQVVDITKDYFASWSPGEQEKIFRTNAMKFYNLYPA